MENLNNHKPNKNKDMSQNKPTLTIPKAVAITIFLTVLFGLMQEDVKNEMQTTTAQASSLSSNSSNILTSSTISKMEQTTDPVHNDVELLKLELETLKAEMAKKE